MENKTIFETLSAINVNEKTEKKSGLTYLAGHGRGLNSKRYVLKLLTILLKIQEVYLISQMKAEQWCTHVLLLVILCTKCGYL